MIRKPISAKNAKPEQWKHGPSCYINHGCRCDTCRSGWAKYIKEYRRRKSNKMTPLPERIHQLVDATRGIKASFLCARLSTEYMALNSKEIKGVIIQMIKSGEIIEIEYLLDGKTNESYLLPPGTVIKGMSVNIQ